MSRRKQSKPRQIKRSIGDLEVGEDNTPDNVSLSGDEGGASDPEDSGECDSSSPPPYTPLYTEEPRTHDSLGSPDDSDQEEKGPTHSEEEEEEEEMEEEEDSLHWSGPDDLGLSDDADDPKVLACRDLLSETLWGPCSGSVQSQEPGEDQGPCLSKGSRLIRVCEDTDCWINRVPLTCDSSEANCSIYSQGKELYCKVTKDISKGDCLVAMLSLSSPKTRSPSQSQGMEVKEEPTGVYPAALHSEIQLLPQQAGMAAILATAVVNKDIFPCKDCGIWYRSERNLQAHLMYYCASRQKHQAPSSPPQDKPKESYPNERVCPFPQCNKSCPSASSLEIHMRTHSGERPFVCLICLSAFTTKANCERHLKVHTDTQNGVCHGCGFVSTTRDILYSHLVTSHMVCQPGSRSEVYSPGPGLPKLPLSTGLSPGDSGVVLKCQVCGHITDSPAQLQQHVRTHLDVRVPAERSPTPRQSTPPSGDLPEPPACLPHPDSSSPGANGSSATPRDCSPADRLPTDVKVKEEPRSDSENEAQEEEMEVGGEGERQEKRHRHAGTASSQTSTSPRSPSAVAVKAEPTSPTPGSSPAHMGGAGSVLPGGTVFLPQYMFSPEVAILPQASEILAKMSEMVHSRLKQGQAAPGAAATFYPAGTTGTVHKGATCYECDITFNNVNNFYVHKRLYCSSRHQQGDQASGAVKEGAPGAAIPSVGQSSSPPSGPGSRAASASPSDTGPVPGSTATEGPLLEVKTENPGPKEAISSSSSEGEGGAGGQASEGSQSPSGSTEDQEDDPTRTFCQACNIHFSRHENYTVHKRFYCASRHDPSNQRSNAGKAAFLPQPIRTRKRKKMYEIHMARTEALANAVAVTIPGLRLSVKQEATASVGRVLEAPVPAPSLRPATSRSASPDGDGPIDLSKRPRLRETPRSGSIPALPLTDYHKCTACSISFNSIENYLAHKTYYCPATTLQPQTLETLHRLKRPTSTSPKSRALERPEHHMEAKGLPTEKAPQGALPSPHPSSLPGSEATSPHSGPMATKAPGSPSVVCPYCPPNVAVTCDLVEHFRSIHGLVLSVEGQHAVVSPSLSPREATPTTPPKTALRTRRETINGRVRRNTVSPSSPLVNGSPLGPHVVGGSSPKAAPPAMSPVRAPPMTVSPVPEVLREVGVLNHQAAVTMLPDKPPLSLGLPLAVPAPPTHKAPLVSPVQNGNSRFCRLCNIKFSSLSTFIAHKKYYCSSHSAEHVK